jgi:hypothetical protein
LRLHFSLPVSFPNLDLTPVGHSVAYRIVVLTPIICTLLQMQCMAGGGDQRWPRNVEWTQIIDHQLCLPWCLQFILLPEWLPVPVHFTTSIGNSDSMITRL